MRIVLSLLRLEMVWMLRRVVTPKVMTRVETSLPDSLSAPLRLYLQQSWAWSYFQEC